MTTNDSSFAGDAIPVSGAGKTDLRGVRLLAGTLAPVAEAWRSFVPNLSGNLKEAEPYFPDSTGFAGSF